MFPGGPLQTNRQDLVYIIVIAATLLLAAGLTWVNYQFASDPAADDAFAPLWAGARIVITRQANPYDLEAVEWVLWPTEAPPSRFVYPYYGILLFLPFGAISSYPLAKGLWMTTTMAGLLAIIFGSLSLTLWRPSGKLLAGFVVFSLTGYSAMRSVYTGNPGMLVGMLTVFGLQSVIRGRSGRAGFLFGLTILKPTLVGLLLPYVFLHAVSKRDFRFIRSMLITMLVLISGAFVAYPNWFYQNFAQVVLLFKETHPASINAVLSSWFPGSRLMLIVAAIFGLWAVVEWWRSFGKDTRWFLWTSALTLVLTMLIGVPVNTSDYVVLLLPLTLVFTTIDRRWQDGGSLLVLLIMVALQGAQWLSYHLLTGFNPSTIEPRFMLFPLPVITLGLLYWVRYWALSSIKLHVERIEALRNL
jgi:hypothetical protein